MVLWHGLLREQGNRMEEGFCEVEVEVIYADTLRISKARDFAKAVEEATYARLVECRQTTSGREIIVLDAEVEVGQKPVHDIRGFERIAVEFEESDTTAPEVLALRINFPRVPHTNLRSTEFPRSLCVTEQNYNEWRLQWTGTAFVEQIRQWLASTAKGRLHAEDQPLEPLLWGSEDVLILPSDLFTKGSLSEPLSIPIVYNVNKRRVFVAERPISIDERNPLEYVATAFQSDPLTHGVIRKSPANLYELHQFLECGNLDLLKELIQRLKDWRNETKAREILDAARLILIVALPKKRHNNTSPEHTEWAAFLIPKSIREVEDIIDPSVEYAGYNIPLLGTNQSERGNDISVRILNPTFSLSRERAAWLNGFSSRDNRKITAVGLGALGSQVFMNLIRAGCGEWTLIDKDFLLPHNLARHALSGFFMGDAKSRCMAELANHTISGDSIANWIIADVLNPSESPETCQKLTEAFGNADIILDASASVSVARYLVHDVDSSARRISIFLNPSGTGVVILAEDEKRSTTLDSLEMQYYRCLVNEPSLENHLWRPPERIRYAASCRDVSSTIPQDFVALQSAICSRAIHQVTSDEKAFLSIWCTDEDQINVQRHLIPVKNLISCEKDEWTLRTDEGLIDKVYKARAGKLPNETGGVLIGAYDTQRKIVYVVDCIPSPPDSEEWPTVYIRGCQGLKAQVKKIKQITGGQLMYIGEWHSHPPGCSVSPSQEDRQVFDWLSNCMRANGLPPLMLIVGDPGKYAFYLERIE